MGGTDSYRVAKSHVVIESSFSEEAIKAVHEANTHRSGPKLPEEAVQLGSNTGKHAQCKDKHFPHYTFLYVRYSHKEIERLRTNV